MSEITIVLEDSTYAHGFDVQNQINSENLKRAVSLIQNQFNGCTKEETDERLMLSHPYNTIGVFGDRGSGKTSFLVSLLQECEKTMPDVEVLRIVDPTLVEHKKPFVLHVIAMINELVTKRLNGGECAIDSEAFTNRRRWEKRVRDLSVGLFAVDEVGKGYDDSLWQDEEYVMHTGLDKVNQSNNFELAIRKMMDEALVILGKKAFLLAFDDIDMDAGQGWGVMEHLRRYLSYRKLITIVSGNIKLYGILVRQKLKENLGLKDDDSLHVLINELESQFMLKLINPSNRINLSPMAAVVKNHVIQIKSGSNETLQIGEMYKKVLQECGILGSSSIRTFTEFLYSMSLRSQIHFLKEAQSGEGKELPMGVFTSRLYEAGIDVSWLKDSPQYINISVMSYLKEKGYHPDGYLLLPTLQDKDINSNFVGLTILACHWFKQSPQGVFDYMLRIGYLRNLVLPQTDQNKVKAIYNYGGWNQLMSLKNNIGLTMAYLLGTQTSNMNEHITLSGLSEVAKKDVKNAIDEKLKNEKDAMVRLLAMFPFVRLKHNRKNVGDNYYSLFVLLSAICDILGCEKKEDMTSRINDLKLFRSYQMPLEGDTTGEMSEISSEDYKIDIDQNAIEKLAGKMYEWKRQYLESDRSIPPYVIGRIMTRVFTAVGNVKGNTVGDVMNLMVCNLFNASLIEESRVRDNIDGSENGILFNNNNLETSTKILLDNLDKKELVENQSFSMWLMECPMLNCFLDKDTSKKVTSSSEAETENSNVYSLLEQIEIKDRHLGVTLYKFFRGKNKWKEMKNILNTKITDSDIRENIINQNPENAKTYIESLDLFKSVRIDSVTSFMENYKNNEVQVKA